MKKFFFPSVFPDASVSRLLLTLRLFFGFLFLMHGIDKLANFEVLSYSFPDPLGMGSHLSLVLVILAEVFCALTFIGGFLFRISLLPMLFAMFIAFFYVQGELAFIYLGVFLLLLVTGPGRYSADYLIYRVVWGT
mgnify:CR=1 FL=1